MELVAVQEPTDGPLKLIASNEDDLREVSCVYYINMQHIITDIIRW